MKPTPEALQAAMIKAAHEVATELDKSLHPSFAFMLVIFPIAHKGDSFVAHTKNDIAKASLIKRLDAITHTLKKA